MLHNKYMVCLVKFDKECPNSIRLDAMTFRNPDKYPEDIVEVKKRAEYLNRELSVLVEPVIIIGIPKEAKQSNYVSGSTWKS